MIPRGSDLKAPLLPTNAPQRWPGMPAPYCASNRLWKAEQRGPLPPGEKERRNGKKNENKTKQKPKAEARKK